jgi:predicted DsbA family dithiol-disulfide isomerase
MLNPGMDKIEFYEQYVPNFLETRPRMRAAALPHGILMSLTGRTGPSRSAHILSRLALNRLGALAQNSIMEELFAGHFDLGRDISDVEWLVEVGRRNGLPEETVIDALASMEAGAEVDREAEVAKSAAVKSVPCVIVEETFIDSYNGEARFDHVFENIRRKQGHVDEYT